MAETTQKNFRMSEETIKLLHSVARAQGVTETDVVQYCVARYAQELGQDVDRATALLLQQICDASAKSPGLHSRAKESLALNEEPRHAPEEAAVKLHEPASDLHQAVRVAEGLVEKARKRSAPKRK